MNFNKIKERRNFILIVFVTIIILSIVTTQLSIKQEMKIIHAELETTQKKYQYVFKEIQEMKQEDEVVVESVEQKGTLHTITCYDLSEDSNGVWKGHKWYGLTASGFDLRGHTWDTARTVAVDKDIYPFGTKLKITFTNSNYERYNGVYTARDTGSAVKGYHLDLFLGDFNQRRTHESVWQFGRTEAYVEVIGL